MEVLQLIAFIGLSVETRTLFAMNCYEEMTYHEKYSYGYDIYCSHLNSSNIHELKNRIVYNEISLTIDNSNLTNISSHLFQNIPKTREIIIEYSHLELQTVPKEGPFGSLHQLASLSIANNNLSAISKDAFRNLDNLLVLNASNNNLGVIEKDTLASVEDLEKLDLSGNNFKNIDQIPLCEASSLIHLYLGRNKLTSLRNSSITCLRLLKLLVLDFNSIAELEQFSQFRYLMKLSLAHNKVEDLGKAFVKVESLKELNLEGNSLKMIKSNCLEGSSELRRLNLRKNLISTIDLDAFSKLTILEDLSLEGNNLTKAPISNMAALQRLSLAHNQLSWEKQEFYNLTSLNFLNLSNCSIRALSYGHFEHLNGLKILDLSFNRVSISSSSFEGLARLRELCLKHNFLMGLADKSFTLLKNLKKLDLSNNQLKQLNHMTFHNLKKLEILNLSYNYLEFLAENVLAPLESLNKLDLEGNRLKYIDYDIIISLLANLRLINIRENKFSCKFLTDMLHYFKEKSINFTINEKLSYDRENVAGIQCQEYDQFNGSFALTDALLLNDSKVLKELYRMEESGTKNLKNSLSSTLLVLVLVFVVLFVSILGISYRIYVVVRRRNRVSDEIELLDARLHKWNYI